MIYITRKAHFNAAHRLYNNKWTEEKNREVFGKCASPNWHGHNFDLFVTIKGQPDPETGFVMNSKKLGNIIKEHVVDQVDHRNLNKDVDFMADTIPTVENFITAIWDKLAPHIEGAQLYRLQLWETRKFYAEYYGE